MNIIELVADFEDERGLICDLLEDKKINAVTYITIKKDAIRGNHFHKKTSQYNFIISGKVKMVSVKENGERFEKVFTKGDFVYSLPMEKHAFIGVEDCEMLVLTEGPRGGKEYETDTFRLDEPLIA